MHDPTALKASAAQSASRVRDVGAVVILRGAFSGRSLLDAASILAEEGLGVIEVTLNSPRPLPLRPHSLMNLPSLVK